MSSLNKKEDISIVLCGAAGQGIKTVEHLLTHVLHPAGYNVFSMKEYMSRVRGGTNSTEIRVCSKPVAAFIERIDLLIPLNKSAIPHLQERITKETIIIGESENIGDLEQECKIIKVPFSDIAQDIGNKIYFNVIAAGLIAELFDIDREIVKDYLKERFGEKGEEILQKNYEALAKGYELGQEIEQNEGIKFKIAKDPSVKNEVIYNGAEIIGMGAIAGGCNFICSYPMSPSTGVLVFLAQHSKEFDIVVEQAEDEIAAINAGLGAFYAGGRSMITTSGGGFSLMCEGLSLAGMTETPIVMHLAQRPGPATGLPTRTEQGDLNLALYSGHGDFPRIILAPGRLEDGFYLAQKAFNLADKYQVPVIILTDQFFMDLYYNFEPIDLSDFKIESHIVETTKAYQRYKWTDNGISPRGIPGYGSGLIKADSDEHDQEGYITEDLHNVRINMVEKRLKKLAEITKNAIPPELVGEKDYEILLVGWGSTYTAIKEAMEKMNRKEIAFLHFKQVYPLPKETIGYLNQAKKIIIIENNVTGQFAHLLHREFNMKVEEQILKFNGLPFSVEELVAKIKKIVED
ncbi:MAG: 2-oxoacid:acceptor oxidoreductase subunit alpha [Candidatus Heimdallarchaeota archaeon]|nr:2-oxoacid:acceptor oxidoreductase subunit alpha [Candidatus Heimdallarchaeota archaeon]